MSHLFSQNSKRLQLEIQKVSKLKFRKNPTANPIKNGFAARYAESLNQSKNGFAVRCAERLSLSGKAEEKLRLRLTLCATEFYSNQFQQIHFRADIAARFSRSKQNILPLFQPNRL